MTSSIPICHPIRGKDYQVRISDLRQWIYCPRVIWWTHVCCVGKVESYKMKKGLEKERRLQHLQKRRSLKSFGLAEGSIESNVVVASEKLRLVGKLDLLVRHGSNTMPVEVKFTFGPAQLNHRLQLSGYALILEELYGEPVKWGYIVRLPDDEVEKVEITEELKELARVAADSVRTIICDEQFPAPTPILGRCRDCEYRIMCSDIAVAPITSTRSLCLNDLS